ncbi:MAG: hypothetical protein FWB98_02370 [Defluviitaleaceae bacterium]|nr:hypothetical protein [Defluviitaleaceae bacterium]
MGINSLHADHITRAGFGFGKSLRMILGLAMIFILMLTNGYVQAHRLVGQWQSSSGNIIIELNRDGTGRHWTYQNGWSEYGEWYVNAFTGALHSEAVTALSSAPFRIRGDNLEKFHDIELSFGGSSWIFEWFSFTRIQNH